MHRSIHAELSIRRFLAGQTTLDGLRAVRTAKHSEHDSQEALRREWGRLGVHAVVIPEV